ncbi:MAG: response regulator [Spirochaetia bacterium]|nr:response regulator [Spirochaetia bacterium]
MEKPKEQNNNNNQIQILIIEDDLAHAGNYKKALEKNNYNLLFAKNAEEALALLKNTQNLALIVTDVQLPDIDGFALSERIRKNKIFQDVPILFISGIFTSEKDIFQGYELGAFDYLIKPVNFSILKAKVKAYADIYSKVKNLEKAKQDLENSNKELKISIDKIIQENKALNDKFHENWDKLKNLL